MQRKVKLIMEIYRIRVLRGLREEAARECCTVREKNRAFLGIGLFSWAYAMYTP